MTDPRLDDQLLAAIRRLPAGSGVVFRHYHLAPAPRRALFGKVRRVCAQRGHLVLLAGDAALAHRWKADGFHGRGTFVGTGLHSAPVHDLREIAAAKRNTAQLLFLSPVRSTRSHAGKRPFGASRFRQLALLCSPAKVIALGGMSHAHSAKWQGKIVHGWAAIDAFIG
jgi:thiamine-phosphate pyrophosphorylase